MDPKQDIEDLELFKSDVARRLMTDSEQDQRPTAPSSVWLS